MAEQKELSGPDFARGVALTEFTDGTMLQGHVAGEPILVARRGDAYFALGAICPHYGAPLATGLIVGDTVRCPRRGGVPGKAAFGHALRVRRPSGEIREIRSNS
jgi:Rieske [2Fe-2S] domain